MQPATGGRMVILGTFCGVRYGLGNPLSLNQYPGARFVGVGVQVHLVVESLKRRGWPHLNLWFKGKAFNGTGGRCPSFPPAQT